MKEDISTIPEVKLESIVVGSEIIESECKKFSRQVDFVWSLRKIF